MSDFFKKFFKFMDVNVDLVAPRYEHATELFKEGKLEEAVEEYKAGLALLEEPGAIDVESRRTHFAAKLSEILWKLKRYEESKPYFEMMGRSMPPIPKDTKQLVFSKGLKKLKKAGFLAELTDDVLKEIIEDEFGYDFESADEDVDLLEFLQFYYQHGDYVDAGLTSQAIADGFISHDWRYGSETDDVVAEICALIGKKLFSQVGYKQVPKTDSMGEETHITVDVGDKGEQSFVVVSLQDIIDFANGLLAENGDKRQFVGMETHGDWYAYYLVDSAKEKKIFGGKTPALERE